MELMQIATCAGLGAIGTVFWNMVKSLYGSKFVTSAIRQTVKKSGVVPLLIVATNEELGFIEDGYAIRAVYPGSKIRVIELSAMQLRQTLSEYPRHTPVCLHIATHGHVSEGIEFRDGLVSGREFIAILDGYVIETLALMTCHGAPFANNIVGEHGVKSVLYTTYDEKIPHEQANDISASFWRQIARGKSPAHAYEHLQAELPFTDLQRILYKEA